MRHSVLVETIIDEMIERDWSVSRVAMGMCDRTDRHEFDVNYIALMLLLGDDDSVKMGEQQAKGLSKAFGVSSEFFLNLERNENRIECPHESPVERFRRLSGTDLTNSPAEDIAFVREANELYNLGFEAAHALRDCGHSRGDYRDAGYIIGRPETYTASEKCVGCEREQRKATREDAGRE